jgi:hypothetical protein
MIRALLAAAVLWPQEPVQTVAMSGVTGRLDHIVFDAKSRRAFVAALGNNTVEVVDLSTGKPAGRIRDIEEPQGIVLLPDANQLVVTSGGDGTCRFYDASSLKLIESVQCGGDADNIRIEAASQRLYVGYGTGGLAVIDAAKRRRLSEIKLDGHPESFQLESRGPRIFVNVPSARQVAVVDREKGSVTAKWKLSAESNYPMALDESRHRLFIGCRKPSKLILLDTETGKETESLECSGDVDDIFVDPGSGKAYLACGEGFIDVFEPTDSGAHRRSERIRTAAGARTSLYVGGDLLLAAPARGERPAELRVYRFSK